MEKSKYEILKAIADHYDQLKSESLDAALRLYVFCSDHHVEGEIYMIDNVKCRRIFYNYKLGEAVFQPLSIHDKIFDGDYGAQYYVDFMEDNGDELKHNKLWKNF